MSVKAKLNVRFIEGLGLGGGTMLAPTYVSENSPRAIRGFLVGFFQLLLVMGGMMAYFINYGSLLHLPVSDPIWEIGSSSYCSTVRVKRHGWFHWVANVSAQASYW